MDPVPVAPAEAVLPTLVIVLAGLLAPDEAPEVAPAEAPEVEPPAAAVTWLATLLLPAGVTVARKEFALLVAELRNEFPSETAEDAMLGPPLVTLPRNAVPLSVTLFTKDSPLRMALEAMAFEGRF